MSTTSIAIIVVVACLLIGQCCYSDITSATSIVKNSLSLCGF